MTVEARSLADITDLAFNPPADPHQLAVESTSLTLYIARVPGSRDVFLTPLKPRDRVVSAQDIASSLYFLHVDCCEDSLIRDYRPQLDQTTHEDVMVQYIARKPVYAAAAGKPLPTPPASPVFEQSEYGSISTSSFSSVPTRKPVPQSQALEQHDFLQPPSLAQSHSGATSSSSISEVETGQTLTLIRRDPATGEQWNVAQIRDPPVDEITSESSVEDAGPGRRIKNAGSPLYIDILHEGYSRFTSSGTQSFAGRPTSLSSLDALPSAQRVFNRRLWMDGSKYANHTYSSRKPLSIASLNMAAHSIQNTLKDSGRHSLAPADYDSRSKGYAFHDVWGQKCEFSSATTSKALRCRQVSNHSPPGDAAYNDLSELRFNLPSQHFAKSDTAGASQETNDRRYSYFSHHSTEQDSSLPLTAHTRGSFSEDGSIDYSLGRERAGGGLGGREAKLGKLIITHQGQKMLDLIVAANLGLWWRAYDRSSQ